MKKSLILRTVAVIVCAFLLVFTTCSEMWAFELFPDEQRMVDLVNRERVVRGLSILKPDSTMTKMARRHSREMIDLNYFAHESPVSGGLLNRILGFNVSNWLIAGENLAGAPSVQIAHSALMKSEKHRENILRPEYTNIGVGVIDGGPYGKMFTQEFITYKSGYASVDTGSIYGRIEDYHGRPIAGAVVRIDKTVIPTNASGEFMFTLVQPGIYTIYYDAAGFKSQVQEYITVNPGAKASPPMVIMTESIEGSLMLAKTQIPSRSARKLRVSVARTRYHTYGH